MPRVETYQPNQVATNITPGARASFVPTNNQAISQGLTNLAGSLQAEQNRLDQSAAEEAVVNFEREKNDLFFNPDTGYFNTQGRDAYDRAPDINKSIEELRQRHSDTLSSPRARQAFNNVAQKHITRSQVDIARHSSKNLKAWEIATINSQVENTLENATLYWNDSERLGVQRALGRQAIIDAADLEGASPETKNERLETYDSSFAKSTVLAAIQSSSKEGEETLDKWEKNLEGSDLLKIKSSLDKKKRAEKVAADSKVAVLHAANLVERFGEEGNARSLIMESVNNIEDPELRAKVTKESMFQLNIKQQADSESRAATFEQAENHIIDGGSIEAFKIQNSDAWEFLTAKQKQILNSGKSITTDFVFLSDLMTLPKEDLAKINPGDHFHKLAPGDRTKLINAVKTARNTGVDDQVGRSRTSQTSAAVEQLFGKKSEWNKKKREQVNVFYGVIDDEVKFQENLKGSPLNSQEYTDLLSAMTKKVVKEGFFNLDFAFGFGNSEVDLTDIPAQHLRALSEFMHENNIPVTAENIMKAYEQARQ